METSEVIDGVIHSDSGGTTMLTQNACSGAVKLKDISEFSDGENLHTKNIKNIKSEFDSDTKIVVLNKHNKFNARQKSDSSSLRHDCNLCELAFQYPYQLARHKKVKHEGKYPYHCNVCSKPFDRRSSLQDHMYVHSEERLHPCTFCEKSYKMRGNLRKHVREMHVDEVEGPKLKFQCEYCFKIFLTKERLTSHFVCHDTVKAYSCDVCGKKYKRKNNLQKHSVIHSSEKKFKCPECNMCFKRKYSLKIHSRNHMAVKPYKCELCPSSFSQLHALKTHFRLHTGEKPFKCTVCPQTFRQLATLQVHLKRHSGVKDFKCMVCARAFVIKRRLTEHMRLHTGEKPFSCKLCPYKTATTSGLRLHNKTHLRQMERSVQNARSDIVVPNMFADARNIQCSQRQTHTSLKGTSVDLVKPSGDPEDTSENVVKENKDLGKTVIVDSDRFKEYIETTVSESAIEIVNDVDFDTNGCVIETGTELETKRAIHSNNEEQCVSDSDNIDVKVSDVRSIASDLNKISDMEINKSCDNVNLKSNNTGTDFQFSTREVLYRYLNDLIPTIDADILSSKIDHIVNDLTDVHEINCNKLGRKFVRDRKEQTSAKCIKTSERSDDEIRNSANVNIGTSGRNSLNQSSEILRQEVQSVDINDYSIVKNEPINQRYSSIHSEQSHSMSEIQASHRTLSQCLSSGVDSIHTISPVKCQPGNIPATRHSGNNLEGTELTSSTLRKLLTTVPKSSINHSMNYCETNTKNYSQKSEMDSQSQKKIVLKSTAGNSDILHEILSKPPQYLIASRNSVATLHHAEQLHVKAKQCKTKRIMSESQNGSIHCHFPWVSIEKIKLEPLSGDEN